MPGFLGIYGNKKDRFSENEDKNLINDFLDINKLYIERRTLNKFLNDKLLFEDENYALLLEGVLLNLNDLKNRYDVTSSPDLILKMHQLNGEAFFKDFRGSFSGVFYDKKSDEMIIFTNHVGDKFLFYVHLEGSLIFGSELNYIIDYHKTNNLSYVLDKTGAYCLLTYGYMLEDYTLLEGVKRLRAGNYLKIHGSSLEVKEYHRFTNNENNSQTEEEIIDNIDRLFLKAVKKQIEKNNEYGYSNYASLSAGLDARMTNYAIRKFYDGPVHNITFSESDYLDETIPKQIARELKNHWHFFSLDNGLCVFNLENVLKMTSGMAYCGGQIHGYEANSVINWENIGVFHSGQIGDVVIGTFFHTESNQIPFKLNKYSGEYSTKLLKKLILIFDHKMLNYENYEIGLFYNRAFNGALGSHMVLQNYTETFSPFYDIEFMEYCLSIPLKYRYNHRIYYKWVLKKYPKAAKYSHNGKKISNVKYPLVKIFGNNIEINRILPWIVKKSKSKLLNQRLVSMNPFNYWYENNSQVSAYMDKYYEKNLRLLKEYDDLYDDCKLLYEEGNVIEKLQVLTLLGHIKIST